MARAELRACDQVWGSAVLELDDWRPWAMAAKKILRGSNVRTSERERRDDAYE